MSRKGGRDGVTMFLRGTWTTLARSDQAGTPDTSGAIEGFGGFGTFGDATGSRTSSVCSSTRWKGACP